MNKVINPIKELLLSTGMTFDEVRAFSLGIASLDTDNQVELYRHLNHDRTLVYPTYINYMAKKRSNSTGELWDEAVNNELRLLESYIEGKRVGDEVKN